MKLIKSELQVLKHVQSVNQSYLSTLLRSVNRPCWDRDLEQASDRARHTRVAASGGAKS